MGLFDRLLDASIVASFDARGFRRHQRRFNPADLDVDLTGRRCLITGANAGLGFATAEGLAARGAEVHLLCRNPTRGEAALADLQRRTSSDRLHLHILDLADLSAVRRFTETFEGPVHVLIHNAGLLPDNRVLTADGHELTVAVHLIAPLVLTDGLRGALLEGAAGGEARVIFVSSGGMYAHPFDPEKLSNLQGRYDGVAAYARTKRAQVLLTERLAEAFSGTRVVFNSMHPGWADTGGVQQSLPRFHSITKKILRDAEQGADTIVWLAASPACAGQTGLFWFDRSPVSTHLLPHTARGDTQADTLLPLLADWADDPALVDRLLSPLQISA